MTLTFTPGPAPDPADPVWRGEVALSWEEVEMRGNSDRPALPDSRYYHLCMGGMWVGHVTNRAWNHAQGPGWGAWDGMDVKAIGWRDTEQEAKDLLVEHVVRLILGDDDGR